MNKFTFSGYVLEPVKRIQRRKWWNIFGKDRIIESMEWVRHHVSLDSAEADLIIEADKNKLELHSLLLKMFGRTGVDNVKEIQLEENYGASAYIATRSKQ